MCGRQIILTDIDDIEHSLTRGEMAQLIYNIKTESN